MAGLYFRIVELFSQGKIKFGELSSVTVGAYVP
jgi:hypothetical protein